MASIPVIPGVKVVTKGVLNKPLKDIICAILFGGLNNLLKGNLLCIQANIDEMLGYPMSAGLQAALKELKAELAAFQEHIGIGETLKRVNEAIADMQKLLALDGMCRIPLKAPKIPNVLNNVAGSFFGAANGLLNQLGQLAKPQLCINASGGINTGTYNPNSILGQMNRTLRRMGQIPSNEAAKFERSIKGISKALRAQINRELFPDFRHKHNLLTGSNTVPGQPSMTVMDVKSAYEQAQLLSSAVNSTGSFPVQCVQGGRGAEADIVFGSEGKIQSINLLGMTRQDVSQDSTSGEGIGAVFNVSGRLGSSYKVELVSGGVGYKNEDTVTVKSTTLKGTPDPDNVSQPSSDLKFTVGSVNDQGAIVKIKENSITGIVEHYQHPDFVPSATYSPIFDVSELDSLSPGLYGIYSTSTQLNSAYRKNNDGTKTLLYEQATGYQGYLSATAQFVDKINFKPIVPGPVIEEFQGSVVANAEGGVASVNIINPGLGYPNSTRAQITGDIVRATATASVLDFSISSLNLTVPGQNYRAADTQIIFRRLTGEEFNFAPASIAPIFDSEGLILQGIQIVNGGAGYPKAPGFIKVKITNTRIKALATAEVVAGKLSSITVTKAGTGYHPTLVSIDLIDSSTGQPISPLQFPIISPVIDATGNLTSVNVISQGLGLPASVEVNIKHGIEYVEALASLEVNEEGTITNSILINAGAGYRPATTQLSIVRSDNGRAITRRKAVFEPVIDSQGNLTGFTKIDGGAGYPAAEFIKVDITDNFSSAQVGVTIGEDGNIKGFDITDAGSGYFNPGIILVSQGGELNPQPQPFVIPSTATGVFVNGILVGMEVLDPGKNYNTSNTTLLIKDETAETCSPGSESQNLWANALGPDVYALVVQSLTPQDPTFVRQEPIYDYCGRLIGYQENVVAGDRAAEGGNPLDGATVEPLELNHEFVWIYYPEENRVGWAVVGVESEQLVGPEGATRLTKALDLNPEITLYRGQSHILSLPGIELRENYPIGSNTTTQVYQEFYIFETREDPEGRPVTKSDGTIVLLKPDTSKTFNQGLHRFETGEYLEEANGRDQDSEVWGGLDLDDQPIPEPDSFVQLDKNNNPVKNINGDNIIVRPWLRKYLYSEGTNLVFQIGEGDPPKPELGELDTPTHQETEAEYQLRIDEWKKNKTGLEYWPDFLAYSDKNGTNFGILRLI